MDCFAAGISGNRLCHVQRRQTAGSPAEQELRDRSGVSEVCENRTDPDTVCATI